MISKLNNAKNNSEIVLLINSKKKYIYIYIFFFIIIFLVCRNERLTTLDLKINLLLPRRTNP